MSRTTITITGLPLVRRTSDAGWDESKHKRADNGQFGSGEVVLLGSRLSRLLDHLMAGE